MSKEQSVNGLSLSQRRGTRPCESRRQNEDARSVSRLQGILRNRRTEVSIEDSERTDGSMGNPVSRFNVRRCCILFKLDSVRSNTSS